MTRRAELVARFARSRPLRFGAVGGVGFIVDAGALHLLTAYGGLGPIPARVASFLAAVTVTWALNRALTFAADASTAKVQEWSRYLAVSVLGGGVNFVIYFAAVAFSSWFAERPVAALAVASAVAMVLNYMGYKHLAFRGAREKDR